MPIWGFPALKVELDDELAAAKDISPYVTHINGWTKEQILEELTSAGDDDERWGVVGFNKVSPVVLTGPYDDAADSLYDVVMIQWITPRTLTLTFDMPGAADVQNVETYIESVEIIVERGKLQSTIVTLQPTGAVT